MEVQRALLTQPGMDSLAWRALSQPRGLPAALRCWVRVLQQFRRGQRSDLVQAVAFHRQAEEFRERAGMGAREHLVGGSNGFDPTQNREGGKKRGEKEKRSAWFKVTANSLIEVKNNT